MELLAFAQVPNGRNYRRVNPATFTRGPGSGYCIGKVPPENEIRERTVQRGMERLLEAMTKWHDLHPDGDGKAHTVVLPDALHRSGPHPRVHAGPHAGMVIRGTWELAAMLGKGGFGVIHEARHRALERTDAIKFLHAHLAHDGEIRRQFHDEAKTMAGIRGEHLVHVYDYGEHEGIPFFVMERLVGESLETLIAREAPLAPSEFFRLAGSILRGVSEIHAHGIVHRDLKPGNVFVEARARRVKILDFGLAMTTTRLSSRQLSAGTPIYMAPELLLSQETRASPATDIYSVGVVLHQMLTGQLPFGLGERDGLQRFMQRLVQPEVEPPSFVGARAMRTTWKLVLRALDRDPDRRPQSAVEFAGRLEAARRLAESMRGENETRATGGRASIGQDARGGKPPRKS